MAARSTGDGPQAGRRPAAAWTDRRSRGLLYVRRKIRRALYHLLRQGGLAGKRAALQGRGSRRCVLLGGRQGRLCREWPRRPRQTGAGHQGGLRADRQERGEEVVMTVVTGLVPVTSLRIGNARVNLSGMAGTSPAIPLR